MRLLFLLSIWTIITLDDISAQAQEHRVDVIQNCQSENRTFTFYSQVNFFRRWIAGRGDLRSQKVLRFSPSYSVDTLFLQQQIEKVRKSLPKDFFKLNNTGSLYEGPEGDRYNNVPDAPAIWFEMVFSDERKTGQVIYAALRIAFDGNDARVTEQRMMPRIANVQFIFDRNELAKIGRHLKTFPPVQ